MLSDIVKQLQTIGGQIKDQNRGSSITMTIHVPIETRPLAIEITYQQTITEFCQQKHIKYRSQLEETLNIKTPTIFDKQQAKYRILLNTKTHQIIKEQADIPIIKTTTDTEQQTLITIHQEFTQHAQQQLYTILKNNLLK